MVCFCYLNFINKFTYYLKITLINMMTKINLTNYILKYIIYDLINIYCRY